MENFLERKTTNLWKISRMKNKNSIVNFGMKNRNSVKKCWDKKRKF